MKKKVLFVASIFLATATFAQDGLTSKKGEAFLPEAGDWALGFDAAPLLNYGGNLFNGTQNNSINAAFQTNDLSITGKYFVDESTAYRGRLRIGFGSTSQETNTDTSTTPEPAYFTDDFSTSRLDIVLGGGIEKRKGNTRIQGYYGGEALIAFSSSSSENDFAISIEDIGPGVIRTTDISNGSSFTFGVRAFIGVEYFIAPKVSIGAEYGWGLGFTSTGESEEDFEWFDAVDGAQSATRITNGSSSSFSLDTDNNGSGITGGTGQINVLFHF